jgi:ParB/RepB/Spo0J family partition protein
MPATTTIPRGTSKAKSNGAVPAKGWTPELHEIPVASIDVGANVRTDVGELAGLVDSIKAVGILEPIRVAEVGAGKYELVYGQRRLAAAKAAGLATIPAVVDAGAEVGQLRAIRQLIENLQREDLNPLEEAKAYRAILDADQEITQAELARRLGRAAPTISNALRLLKLPAAVQKRVADGSLSASHAKAIASLPDSEAVKVAERVSKGKVSAHDVEREIRDAQARQAQVDRDRDNVKAVLPKVVERLAKAKATKADVVLVVVNEALREALLADGWSIADLAHGQYDYLYGGAKDPCDAYMVNWHATWGAQYAPDLNRVCVDRDHRKARNEDAERAREQQSAEIRARNEKAEAERKAAAAADAKRAVKIAAALASAKLPVGLVRALVGALAMSDDYIGSSDVSEAFVDRHVAEDDRDAIYQVDDPVWSIVEKLDETAALTELGILLLDRTNSSAGVHSQALALAGEKPKAAK